MCHPGAVPGPDGRVTTDALRNWAGNHPCPATVVNRPATVARLLNVVVASPRLGALGSRHCFDDIVERPAGDSRRRHGPPPPRPGPEQGLASSQNWPLWLQRRTGVRSTLVCREWRSCREGDVGIAVRDAAIDPSRRGGNVPPARPDATGRSQRQTGEENVTILERATRYAVGRRSSSRCGVDALEVLSKLVLGEERSATADQHRVGPGPVLVDETQGGRLGAESRAADGDSALARVGQQPPRSPLRGRRRRGGHCLGRPTAWWRTPPSAEPSRSRPTEAMMTGRARVLVGGLPAQHRLVQPSSHQWTPTARSSSVTRRTSSSDAVP